MEAEALQLSVQDRARLARRLLESLDENTVEDRASVELAWQIEIEHRIAEYDAGGVSPIGASDVLREARVRLRQRY